MTFNTVRQLVQFKKQRSKLHAVYHEFGSTSSAAFGCVDLWGDIWDLLRFALDCGYHSTCIAIKFNSFSVSILDGNSLILLQPRSVPDSARSDHSLPFRSTQALLGIDACDTITDNTQRSVCKSCMGQDAASSLEVCLYMAVHQDYPVNLTYDTN
jgi:hypothetical protein